jgi:crossover junction endodeoxyribonuclease RusA
MKGFPMGRRVILTDSNAQLKPWRSVVALKAQEHAPETPLTGAIYLSLAFFLPVPKSAPKRRRLHAIKKPDCSKLVRAVEDAFTGILWADDAQVVQISASKQLAYDHAPGVSVHVEELEPITTAVVRARLA